MPAEQQLERSVLERKEREELRAIAQAMSLQTTSRSKKADIIDLILRAAGVEVADSVTKSNGSAAGGRTRKAASQRGIRAGRRCRRRGSNDQSLLGQLVQQRCVGQTRSQWIRHRARFERRSLRRARRRLEWLTSEKSCRRHHFGGLVGAPDGGGEPGPSCGRPDRIPPARSSTGSSGPAGDGRFRQPSLAEAARQGEARAPGWHCKHRK